MNITYRNITKSDFRRIRKLIKRAWFEPDYIPGEYHDYSIYAKAYLYLYLSDSSYRLAAYDGDKLVGFLFGRVEGEKIRYLFRNKLSLFFTGFSMLFTKIGRRGLRVHIIEKKTNKKLREQYDKEDNELCLFIVDAKYRKQGIGSTLENYFCEHLKSLNKHELYLYTDTYSNYHYYEDRGYYRYKSYQVQFDVDHDGDVDNAEYYIYVKELNNESRTTN